ncbi:P-loop NTPase fold protein, partial [Streptococcus pyogenes]
MNKKKTYFLNGSWGSGKTTFLKNVDEKYDEKLVFIDLWQISDSRPLLEIVFSKFHPVYYWGFLALTIILVSVSILSTNVVNLGLEKY